LVSHKSRQRAKHEREKAFKERRAKQRELTEQLLVEAIRADYARRLANEEAFRQHQMELEMMRRRILEMQQEEELERARQLAVEADRIAAVRARAAKRFQPFQLEPKAAFNLWLERVAVCRSHNCAFPF
jgi:hypothetical protein